MSPVLFYSFLFNIIIILLLKTFNLNKEIIFVFIWTFNY